MNAPEERTDLTSASEGDSLPPSCACDGRARRFFVRTNPREKSSLRRDRGGVVAGCDDRDAERTRPRGRSHRARAAVEVDRATTDAREAHAVVDPGNPRGARLIYFSRAARGRGSSFAGRGTHQKVGGDVLHLEEVLSVRYTRKLQTMLL